MKFFVFTEALNPIIQVTHDTGWMALAVPDIHPTGRGGYSVSVPSDTPDSNGFGLMISAVGKNPFVGRGILLRDIVANQWFALMDDFTLLNEKVCPEPIPVPPIPVPPANGRSPKEIIDAVYAAGQFDLATDEGCGKFTEACCDSLHREHSLFWGYCRALPPKNNYNNHRTDAVQLLAPVKGIPADYYDIIDSSGGDNNRKPSFNSKGPTIKKDWYYPAGNWESHI